MIFQVHVIKLTWVSMVSKTFAEFNEFLKLLRFWGDRDRDMWQRYVVLFKRVLTNQFLFFWEWLNFWVNFVFDEIWVFFCVQVIYLDRIVGNIRKIVVYSQGSNFSRSISSWWNIWVRLEMAALHFLGLVHLVLRNPESGSFLTNWVFLSQGWQIGRTCRIQAIVGKKAICLSRDDLLSLDARIAIWGPSVVILEQVNSFFSNLHDGVGCVFFVGHF